MPALRFAPCQHEAEAACRVALHQLFQQQKTNTLKAVVRQAGRFGEDLPCIDSARRGRGSVSPCEIFIHPASSCQLQRVSRCCAGLRYSNISAYHVFGRAIRSSERTFIAEKLDNLVCVVNQSKPVRGGRSESLSDRQQSCPCHCLHRGACRQGFGSHRPTNCCHCKTRLTSRSSRCRLGRLSRQTH